jgi:hypothetical protein
MTADERVVSEDRLEQTYLAVTCGAVSAAEVSELTGMPESVAKVNLSWLRKAGFDLAEARKLRNEYSRGYSARQRRDALAHRYQTPPPANGPIVPAASPTVKFRTDRELGWFSMFLHKLRVA